jgi:hypothetical protein
VDFIALFSVSRYLPDLRILKNGGIKIHRFLRVTIEPQAWGDFLHIVSFRDGVDRGKILKEPFSDHEAAQAFYDQVYQRGDRQNQKSGV